MRKLGCFLLIAVCFSSGCSEPVTAPVDSGAIQLTSNLEQDPSNGQLPTNYETKKALYGDLHVHTKLSFDAWIFGTRATPDQAYEFAKGKLLKHASGFPMQLRRPLDFLAVTDHGTYLGILEQMSDPNSAVGDHPLSQALREAVMPDQRNKMFQQILPRERGYVKFEDNLLDLNIVRSAWQEVVASANRHNDPGEFTTFIGYEFTAGGRKGENLHRNVIFKDAEVPELPYTRIDAENNPENLWAWMDKLRSNGVESLAIPHNSNGSNGWMFEETYRDDRPIDQFYAEQRMRNEPIVEVTQVKGTSDTHPILSSEDEWADFEIMDSTIGTEGKSQAKGSYVRDAYLTGLALAEANVGNPYKFGLIGSSDTHNAAGSFYEDNYWSKTGLLDITPEQRGSVPNQETGAYLSTKRSAWGASGLAAVWSEENTREAIFDAFRRKETFATTGPRIQVRFFATFEDEVEAIESLDDVKKAYQSGYTMGSDVALKQNVKPKFLVAATQDPLSAPLERLQIIKGWIENGEKKEKVFDVMCATGDVNPSTHRCESDSNASLQNSCDSAAGASGLSVVWQDDEFFSDLESFYYVRGLEVSTCRWSNWDAIRAGKQHNPKLVKKIQERVWSSPIWFIPS
jgi:hypothetical protein